MLNGSATGVIVLPASAPSEAASFSWSNAGRFSCVSASTSTNSLPPFTDRRYQNRLVSSTQVAASGTPTTAAWYFSRKLAARS